MSCVLFIYYGNELIFAAIQLASEPIEVGWTSKLSNKHKNLYTMDF